MARAWIRRITGLPRRPPTARAIAWSGEAVVREGEALLPRHRPSGARLSCKRAAPWARDARPRFLAHRAAQTESEDQVAAAGVAGVRQGIGNGGSGSLRGHVECTAV